MFWPAKMCKVRLIGLKSNLKQTIEVLEEYGGAEIKKFRSEEIQNSKPLEEFKEISENLVRMEALAKTLSEASGKKFTAKEAKELLTNRETRKLEKKIREISEEMERESAEYEELGERIARLKEFSKFDIDFSRTETMHLRLLAGRIAKANKAKLDEALGRIGAEAVEKPLSQTTNIAIIAVPSSAFGVDEELQKAGFERTPMPKIEGKPSRELEVTAKKLEDLKKRKELLKAELNKISRQSYSKIAAMKEYLAFEDIKATTAEKFGATEHSFVVEAFLPEKNYSEFEKLLKQKFGQEIYLKEFSSQEIDRKHEKAPTLLEHSKIISPFEFMTKFISIPKHNEIDPTLVFLVFFQVFYGMIVGDFVYGIISLLLARFFLSKVAKDSILYPVSIIWMWSAIPAIVFGLIFDEFAGMPNEMVFGLLGFEHFSLYHGLERMHNIEAILAASILLGVFTMAFGFLLGFINAVKHNDRKHAVAKLAWFGIVAFGAVFVSTLMFNSFPQEFLLPSGIVLIVSVALVIYLEGIIGAMEIPSVAGNVLSFARILAVGLVGTVIAFILNDLAFPSPDKGLLIILFLPLYIGGHVFNAFLAMFEALIQGARLNYVEFYSKFYEGGGKEFSPFKFHKRFLRD